MSTTTRHGCAPSSSWLPRFRQTSSRRRVDQERPTVDRNRIPVLVGAWQITQREPDPARARSPIDLMADAARGAADDAEIGRAWWRERGDQEEETRVGAVTIKKNIKHKQ